MALVFPAMYLTMTPLALATLATTSWETRGKKRAAPEIDDRKVEASEEDSRSGPATAHSRPSRREFAMRRLVRRPSSLRVACQKIDTSERALPVRRGERHAQSDPGMRMSLDAAFKPPHGSD
jgi:hypothetical protein